jgi:hypothetical protein
LPFGVVLSLVGGLGMLAEVVSRGSDISLPTAAILILVFGLVQSVVAVIALLFDWEVIKAPARAAVPYGYQPGPGFPPPFPPGQQPHQGPPAGPPSGPFNPQQQTHFLQQPGQFSQPGGFVPPPNGE